ncbi:hypothetical protein D3C78_1395010 [compost metagenome]
MLKRLVFWNVATTAFQDHGHFAFVVQGVGYFWTDQRFVVGRQAAVEAREQCRVVRLSVGRLLGVIGVVQADTDDFPRFAHQRQVVLFTDFDTRALGVRTIGDQIHATFEQ